VINKLASVFFIACSFLVSFSLPRLHAFLNNFEIKRKKEVFLHENAHGKKYNKHGSTILKQKEWRKKGRRKRRSKREKEKKGVRKGSQRVSRL
jgi:hypothetical protein